jgi:LmbE family N-acetylglucosaminyl deacetylase
VLKLELAGARKLLFLGSHADDIEIGCGGTILTLTDLHPDLEVRWVVLSGDARRAREANASARLFLEKAGRSKIVTKRFKESYFPSQLTRIKDYFETLKRFDPDLIFTHHRQDRHQDHRVVSELTWNTFRDHFILEYEIPKYDGDLGHPNFFFPVSREMSRRKAANIYRLFESQKKRQWFSEDTFLALMRLRGVECGAEFAEAFYGWKIVSR